MRFTESESAAAVLAANLSRGVLKRWSSGLTLRPVVVEVGGCACAKFQYQRRIVTVAMSRKHVFPTLLACAKRLLAVFTLSDLILSAARQAAAPKYKQQIN